MMMSPKTRFWITFAAAAMLAQGVFGQCLGDLQLLDPQGGGVSGVATDGDHLVVGGSAIECYQRLGAGWVHVQNIHAGCDNLALDGQWLAVAEGLAVEGRIRLYRLVDERWTFYQQISISTSFGYPRVAIQDDRLLIGREGYGCSIYEFDTTTAQWGFDSRIWHAAEAVAIDGDRIAVSAPGHVHVYDRAGDGQWSEVLMPPPPSGWRSYGFTSLALDGDLLFVADYAGGGAVYVYNRVGAAYSQTAALRPPESYYNLGFSIDASDGILVASAARSRANVSPGYVLCAFTQSATGWGPAIPIELSASATQEGLSLAAGQLALAVPGIVCGAGVSDFDHNGIVDRCDVAAGTYIDADCDLIPDVSPLDRDGPLDCDGDGHADNCPPDDDCDLNGVSDFCQITAGLSMDCNANGRPDWCDLDPLQPDASADCNLNEVPDECDIASGLSSDCNGNGVPDECDPDCNSNSIPDDCDIASGVSQDCNDNGIPDECDPDCDGNGLPDDCDLADGAADCNSNGLLDACECSINTNCRLVQFTDVTAAAGLAAISHDRIGVNHYSGGGAVGDFDRDGWQDIYFVAGGAPDQLYINNGDGTFRNETAAWGLLPGGTQGAAVADYDGDGWLDVFVSGTAAVDQPCRLYHNSGAGTFTDVAAAAGVQLSTNAFSAAWGDYDSDGDLDFIVSDTGGTSEIPSQTTLFRNLGDGVFADVTVAAGLAEIRDVGGYPGVRFADFDGDDRVDILGTSSPSIYYANGIDGLVRRPFSVSTGLGGGSAVADFDGDGDFDIFFSSLRLTVSEWSLGINYRPHSFGLVSIRDTADWSDARTAADAVDIDHDTRPDVVVATKFTGAYLYHNVVDLTAERDEQFRFNNVRFCTNLASEVQGRGLATFDYDNDGDRDVILFPQGDSSHPGPATLFRNDLTGPDTNWICIFLDTSAATDIPPDGIGSVVKVRLGEGDGARTLMDYIDGGSNYLSQSEMSAHFGLAGATVIDEIIVEWTNGTTTTLTDVPVNQTLTIAAPATTCPADLDRNATVDVFDLLLFIDRWFAGDANVDHAGSTDVFDLLAYLDAWFTGC